MKRILIAYFSHSGNTKAVADSIKENAGGDIFEIKTAESYPAGYNAVVEKAKEEQKTGYRPELVTKVKDMKVYDIVFVGYPNWWATMPMGIFTFFETYNFSGKTVIPFCTHEGSGLGRSVRDIQKLCPASNILDGLAVRGSSVQRSRNEIAAWLQKLGLAA